jgi:hypothetical protein
MAMGEIIVIEQDQYLPPMAAPAIADQLAILDYLTSFLLYVFDELYFIHIVQF